MSALKSSSLGVCGTSGGGGVMLSVSPPDVSLLDTSVLPELSPDGAESTEELRDDERDSEQQPELFD